MGKGDKKTTRGKRIAGSYGKTRPRRKAPARKLQSEAKASASETEDKPKTTRKKKTEE